MSVPYSTYRLQLHGEFGFDAASSVVDYLHDLGISHVYCSPYLQAAPGSKHGYDVVDYHAVSAEIGGPEGLDRFVQTLRSHELGQILDIVPNHMAITGDQNRWWWDVLKNGPASRHAPYFDIEWNAPEERLRNKILLPVLGDHYGRVLAAGDLKLAHSNGHFAIHYAEHSFPVAPESTASLLATAADRIQCGRLAFLADSLSHLPFGADAGWEERIAHHRNKEVIGSLLEALCKESPKVAEEIGRVVAELNQDIAELDDLLSQQHYRLSFWRTAERELVYRRFFDINSLVAVRVEEERVFEDTHELVLKWLRSGALDGVRVDHPDGLRDPARYFRRLHCAAPKAWIVAEKILARGERIPDSWNIAGTTGYDFLNLAGGLFIDPHGEAPLNELYRDFTGESVDFNALVRDKKALVLRDILGSDINRLTALFIQICEDHRDHRDYTRHEIHEAIREIVACFPVYRSYAQAETGYISEADEAYILRAANDAKAGRPEIDGRLFDFLADVLLLRVTGELESEFVMRLQQVTAAAVAKGVEDTAFYCFVRLVALNEVGGDPGIFGTSVDDFHKWCGFTQEHQPCTMLSTATHDTKRSEDVRTRISLLSEIPDTWSAAVKKWSANNAQYRTLDLPDRKTEYLLYQTMVGAWPISKDRLLEYMRKAVREAKERTSWLSPNTTFEEALEEFIEGVFGDTTFLEDLEGFVSRLVLAGRINSLSLVLLKLTAPGIPDTYQGADLWDLSLVDPDNRRPVDYGVRKRLLAELDDLSPEQIMERGDEGLPKLWTIRQTLHTRRAQPETFGPQGPYRALWPSGPKAANLIAFQRGDSAVTVAQRLLMSVGGWDSTNLEIPEGTWRNQLTGDLHEGGKLEAGAIVRRFPVALLTKEPA